MSIKVIIIDDNIHKIDKLKRVLDLTGLDIELTVCNVWQTGMTELKDNDFDLLLLDMQFPRREGDRITPDMGFITLKDINRYRQSINIEIVVMSTSSQREFLDDRGFNHIPTIRTTTSISDESIFDSLLDLDLKVFEELKHD